jgi:deoxyribodipyrimidine photo-lyase
MLWGKKVMEWSRTPEEAYATLVHLNNRYALDGRDPNSWTGILWCFGLFDRPWAPERRSSAWFATCLRTTRRTSST